MICIKCSSKIKKPNLEYSKLICKYCGETYLIVENIPIMLSDKNDFYNYRKIFSRLVESKNEKN